MANYLIIESEIYRSIAQDTFTGYKIITVSEFEESYNYGEACDGRIVIGPSVDGRYLHKVSKRPLWFMVGERLDYYSIYLLEMSEGFIPCPQYQDKTGTGFTSLQRETWYNLASELFLETEDILERERIAEVVKAQGFEKVGELWDKKAKEAEDLRRMNNLSRMSAELSDKILKNDKRGAIYTAQSIHEQLARGVDVERLAESASRPIDFERVRDYFGRADRSVKSEWEIYSRQLNQTDTRAERNIIIFPRGELSLIAAPRSHGKTTALLSIAAHIARTTKKHVYYITFEEVEEVIVSKLLRSWNSWTGAEFKEWIERGDYSAMAEACDKLHVLYWKGRTVETLRDVLEMVGRDECGAVIVDYIQRVPTEISRVERRLEVGAVCEVLEYIAQVLDVPVIAGSQMNRDTKNPNPKTFKVSNMEESSKVEQIASFVLGVWALKNVFTYEEDEIPIFKKMGCPLYDIERPDQYANLLFCNVLKNRNGWGALQDRCGLLEVDWQRFQIHTLSEESLERFERRRTELADQDVGETEGNIPPNPMAFRQVKKHNK